MDNTQSHAREQTHKTMRQQSSKLSEEIKQNFRTTFKTTTETSDTQSKRYLLTNTGDTLVNYELRRKMRHLAVQVQDIGSYLCWQTYVDDPGAQVGVARLVHVGTPPDMSRIPIPEMVVPPKAFSQDVDITIPFISLDDASNDDDFDNGSETSLGWFDSTDHIQADIQQGPVRCEQSGFVLTSAAIDAQGADARMHVERSTIVADPGTPGAYTFTVHLDHVNFASQNSLHAKATLNWEPVVNQIAIDAENAKRLALFTAKEQEAFRTAFLERVPHADQAGERPATARGGGPAHRGTHRGVQAAHPGHAYPVGTGPPAGRADPARRGRVVGFHLRRRQDVVFRVPGMVAATAAPQSRRDRWL